MSPIKPSPLEDLESDDGSSVFNYVNKKGRRT